jgi:hypothetical protein
MLAALPDPGPAPPDVVDRITATLHRLAAEDLAPDLPRHGASVPGGAVVVPLARRRLRPLLLAAAAALVVVGGGGVLSQLDLTGRSAGSAASTAGGATAEGAAKPPSDTKAADGAGGAVAAVASGRDYTRAGLPDQARQLLSTGPQRAVAGLPPGPLTSPTGLQACVRALDLPDARLLAADLATFEGAPAAVIVLQASGGQREVWVVDRACRPGADGTKYFAQLP